MTKYVFAVDDTKVILALLKQQLEPHDIIVYGHHCEKTSTIATAFVNAIEQAGLHAAQERGEKPSTPIDIYRAKLSGYIDGVILDYNLQDRIDGGIAIGIIERTARNRAEMYPYEFGTRYHKAGLRKILFTGTPPAEINPATIKKFNTVIPKPTASNQTLNYLVHALFPPCRDSQS
ncbi:hypothetical protein C4580_04440 [Candidatus Woesearchaeota archaeon]|nr:MAG: hypothetical protein C4580_04440 [Candidatus Woesearchaeota archaeon]